jgi:ribonuclease HII
MPVIAGIDEVGYGPSLGPLVVCSFAFRTARPAPDLWELLDSAVSREADGRRLPVNDSKLLYSPDRGIGALEPTALAFLAMLPQLPGRSFRRLASRVCVGGDDALSSPWYQDADFAIPQTDDDLGDRAVALWDAMRRAGLAALGCRAAWVEPGEFNKRVRSEANKSDLLFDRACALVRSLLEEAPVEDVTVFLGKQGGRRMYLPGLVREFGSVWVLEETPATSTYEFTQKGRRVRLTFLRDGEDRYFGIALASMIGKYLREGAMRLFNEYWRRQRPDVEPTSGYGADGRRFFREIEEHLARLSLPKESVVRSR